MSVYMRIHLPFQGAKDSLDRYLCFDHFLVDQDYSFMGHIIDMSLRRESDPTIPEKPFIQTKQMTQKDTVVLTMNDYSEERIPDQDFYICRAGEFKKLPDTIETSAKNKAIALFLKSLEPTWFVIIEMRW